MTPNTALDFKHIWLYPVIYLIVPDHIIYDRAAGFELLETEVAWPFRTYTKHGYTAEHQIMRYSTLWIYRELIVQKRLCKSRTKRERPSGSSENLAYNALWTSILGCYIWLLTICSTHVPPRVTWT